jgi:hypothetical protein
VELHHHAVVPQQHPLHYQPQKADGEEYQLKADNVHHGPERDKFKEIPIPERAPTLGRNVEKEGDSRSARVEDHNHTNTQKFVHISITSWTTFTGPTNTLPTYKDPARRMDGSGPFTEIAIRQVVAGANDGFLQQIHLAKSGHLTPYQLTKQAVHLLLHHLQNVVNTTMFTTMLPWRSTTSQATRMSIFPAIKACL